MNVRIMDIILKIIEWIFAIPIALIYYKNGMQKARNIFSFYKTISEYKFLGEGLGCKLVTCMLIVSDYLIALTILIPIYRVFSCILGISTQLFYIVVMIVNYNLSSNYNCGCFTLNVPKHIDYKSIALSLLVLSILISLLILISN